MLLPSFYQLLLNISQIVAEYDEFLITTSKLPEDRNFMPSIGNGQLGYTVFGDAIYMNGIYNGQHGESRRARIPNWLNFSVEPMLLHTAAAPDFELNLRDGYFRWQQQYNDATATGHGQELMLQQRTYAHRYYNRALIYELRVQRFNAEEALCWKLTQQPGAASDAFDFTPASKSGGDGEQNGFKVLRGTTRRVEDATFQQQRRNIFIVFSEDFEHERRLEMAVGQKTLHYRYVITIDTEKSVALQEMQAVLKMTSDELLERHAAEWHALWRAFNITVKGNIELSHTINAGIFYIATSLPSHSANQRNSAYFGLSPTGLSRGQLASDYLGHNFWDTEVWMLPAVTQFSAAWAKALLDYRLQHLQAAKYNANITGYRGARFPWESAYTGIEVIQPCCLEIAAQEVHISADIVFALEQYFTTTQEPESLCQLAWPIVSEVATFLEGRVEYNATTDKYHIKGIMGPDEDHPNVNDNVYTNVIFKLALEFASFARSICVNNSKSSNDNWLNIAERMYVLYDASQDYHPQHEGYQRSEEVKQADTILLGYPLQYKMNDSTRLNDLQQYERVMRVSGPAMTWSMFAINYLDIKEQPKSDLYFEKSYRDYVRPEFKVWSETRIGYSGSANFLTGIGGFLQVILNGYAGIRFYRAGLQSVMEIKNSYLLPNTEELILSGIKFAQAQFQLHIKGNSNATLSCLKLGAVKMELQRGTSTYRVFEGYSVDLAKETIYVNTLAGEHMK